HRHVPNAARSRKERSLDRQIQTDAASGNAHFPARLFEKSRAAPVAQFATRHYRRGKTPARSGQNIRGTIQPARIRRIRTDGNFAGRERELARAEADQTKRTSAAIESIGFGRKNGAWNRGRNSRTGNGPKTFAPRNGNGLVSRGQHFRRLSSR